MSGQAGIFNRIVAAVIDHMIASLFFFLPVLGGLFGIFYILGKDAIMYRITGHPGWQNKSIGKHVMNLRVECQDIQVLDLATSARRNLPLIPGRIVGIIPLIGWVIGPVVGAVAKLVELFVLTSSPEGIRLGDRLARTKVIDDES